MKQKFLTDEHAVICKEYAAKTYRPANGSEGEFFMESWCCQCTKIGPCRIIHRSMAHDSDSEHYPKELIYDWDGHPKCTAFEAKEPNHDRR